MDRTPTFLLVAGEASGDLHGARLMAALSSRLPGVRFAGMGGPLMQKAGLHALYDASEISVMGFTEVIPRLPRILRVLSGLARWARAERPMAAVLIDIPDFNLLLARRLKKLGMPVAFYVAPMAWAWRPGRTRALRRFVDQLLCIYPFEEPWFRARGVNAAFVGNPLLEEGHLARPPDRAAARRALGLAEEGRVLALLPGSRASEIRRVLPDMLAAASLLAAERPDLHLVLPVAPGLPRAPIEEACRAAGLKVTIADGHAVEVLAACDVAAVCSGTATLEAALALRPMVVAYRASALSFFLARRLVRVPHASIVNLLAGRGIVPELLQEALSPAALAGELAPLLDDPEARARMVADLSAVRRSLGGPGASERAAGRVLDAIAALPAGRAA